MRKPRERHRNFKSKARFFHNSEPANIKIQKSQRRISLTDTLKSRARNMFITMCLHYKSKLPKSHAGRLINSNLLYKHVVANCIPVDDWKLFIIQQIQYNSHQWLDSSTLDNLKCCEVKDDSSVHSENINNFTQ